jgi:hypothetical protein
MEVKQRVDDFGVMWNGGTPMNATRLWRYGLVLILLEVNLGAIDPGHAAPPAIAARPGLAPVLVLDDEFDPAQWTVTAQATGGSTYSVTQQLTGGYASAPFRFMVHRIPPVTNGGLNTIEVTHVYTGYTYEPASQGDLVAIDYSEAGRILSFPWPDAFSTTQPVVVQAGQVYRSPSFIRFIAANSTHTWEVKSLLQLTAADFILVGGSQTDHPDFSSSGGPLQFGFTRNNSRGATQPPVPSDQDLVIEQGVDRWQLILHRQEVDPPNQPPVAVDDIYVLDGNHRTLPLFEIFDVVQNDGDPDVDSLEVISTTEPLYGTVGILSAHTVVYQLDEAQVSDSFEYTISDDEFPSTAHVQIFIDCACTVLCLNNLTLPGAFATGSTGDKIDLALMYAVRDWILKPTPHGQRYVDMYYTNTPEILASVMLNEALRTEAVAVVEQWQPNLRNLIESDGSALITQAQVDAVESFLMNLSAVASPALQQLIADELQRLGPLDEYVGLTMKQARTQAIGDPTLYLPLVGR